MIKPILVALLLQLSSNAELALHLRPDKAADAALFQNLVSEILFATGLRSRTDPQPIQKEVLIQSLDSDRVTITSAPGIRALPNEPIDAALSGAATAAWLHNADIEEITFHAGVGTVASFVMHTRARNAEVAEVLADHLRAYLIPFRSNPDAPAAVLETLRQARVTTSGNSVELAMTFSPEAMQRIRNNEASAGIVKWKFVPDDRQRWQRTSEIFDALGVKQGSRVADVGAGDGYMSVRLARLVGPGGKVYAVDINGPILSELEWRAKGGGLNQIDIVLGDADDPKLPPDTLDAVLIVNSYHEMPEHQKILEHIFRALKPGGRLVIVEPYFEATRNSSRADQEKKHLIAPELVVEDLRRAGFEIQTRQEEFVRNGDSRQWLIVSRRP